MAFKRPYSRPFLVFNLRTRLAEQILFITRIYNELIDGRTFLLSPTAIAVSYDEPQMFLKFYQLYYDPFIINCLDILQTYPDPRFSALPIHDALTNVLTRFRLTPVNRFRQEAMSQFLRHFFFESTLFETSQTKSPADPRH
jgi:hypothetical protein